MPRQAPQIFQNCKVKIILPLMMLSLDLAAGVGELLGEKRPVGMLRAISSAMGVMLGLILCYGMMILVSVAVLLLLGTPG